MKEFKFRASARQMSVTVGRLLEGTCSKQSHSKSLIKVCRKHKKLGLGGVSNIDYIALQVQPQLSLPHQHPLLQAVMELP